MYLTQQKMVFFIFGEIYSTIKQMFLHMRMMIWLVWRQYKKGNDLNPVSLTQLFTHLTMIDAGQTGEGDHPFDPYGRDTTF